MAIKIRFLELSLLSDAIDGDKDALDWLNQHNLQTYMIIVIACQGSNEAKNYLAKNKLDFLYDSQIQ